MVKFHDSGPKLSKALLAETELKLGVELPPAYKSFLLKQNGGKPDPCFFPGSKETCSHQIGEFFGIHEAPNNLESECRMAWENLPRSLVPIGCWEGYGNFYIGVSPDFYGQIFYIDSAFLDEPPWTVCESITEFIAGLTDEETAEKQGESREPRPNLLEENEPTVLHSYAVMRQALGELAGFFEQFDGHHGLVLVKPLRGVVKAHVFLKTVWHSPDRDLTISIDLTRVAAKKLKEIEKCRLIYEDETHLYYFRSIECEKEEASVPVEAAEAVRAAMKELIPGAGKAATLRKKKK